MVNINKPRMPEPIYPLRLDDSGDPDILNCQICDTEDDGEMGEFSLPEPTTIDGDLAFTIVAHGQCALDHALNFA